MQVNMLNQSMGSQTTPTHTNLSNVNSDQNDRTSPKCTVCVCGKQGKKEEEQEPLG